MNRLAALFAPPAGELRTLKAIRARHALERRVVRALGQRWTIARIMSTHSVSRSYICDVADKHDLPVARPSDNWVGRP